MKAYPNPQWKDAGDYKEPVPSTDNVRVPRLEVDAATAYIDVDESGNLIFVDGVTGSQTLAQLAAGGGGGTPADTVTAETSFGASSNAGAATTYSRGDHTHGTPAVPKLDDLTAPDDNTDLDTSTTKHGLAPKAVAPAAGLVNVYGIANGETAISNKALFDATSPTTQAFGDAAATGTATVSARRDHKHAMPANPVTGHESSYDHTKLHSQNTDTGTSNATFAINGANAIVEGDARLTDDRDPNAHAASHAVGGADTVFPADPGADRYLKWDDDPGQLVWADAGGGGGDVSNPLTEDLDFAKFKAVAMCCDNSTTLPTDPATGQWYLHTPTGRSVLYQYSGSAWIPIICGAMTLYVDNTDGTDDLNHGTGIDADAFKTVQYAVNVIPGLVGGNVIIYINNETYNEAVVIRGKMRTGDYTITVQGVLASTASLTATGAGQQGATTTLPTFVQNGLTTNQYQNKLLKFTSGSNNGLYRVIDSNNTTTIALGGPALNAAPAVNDTATVYDWGTTLTSLLVDGVLGVIVNDVKCNSGVGNAFNTKGGASVQFYRCYGTVTFAGQAWRFEEASRIETYQCLYTTATNGTTGFEVTGLTVAYLNGTKAAGPDNSDSGVRATDGSMVLLRGGSILDNFVTGLFVIANSMGNCWCADVYNVIRNCSVYGVRATYHGQVVLSGNNVYSGNGMNESASAADFSCID